MKQEPTSGKIRPDANEGNVDGAHISDFPSEGPGSAARATKTLPGFPFLFVNMGLMMI